MRAISLVVGLLGLWSCGSELECEESDRKGIYLFQYTRLSGSCGPLRDELAEVGGGAGAVAGVCSNSKREFSENACKLEAITSCDAGEGTIEATAVTEQMDDEGDVLEGTMDLSIVEVEGLTCRSVYEVKATRQ